MTVGEYYDFVTKGYLNVLTMTKNELFAKLKNIEQLDQGIETILSILSSVSLFEFLNIMKRYPIEDEKQRQNSVIHLIGLYDLYVTFKDMFEFCFKEDMFDKISSSEEFEMCRDLIIEINCIPYEKPNPNPEIERYNQMKRLMQKNKGESIDWESMYTSVGLALGRDPDDITLYKFHKYFERIAQFKNYDTSTLFATVSDKVKIEPWFKKIEYEEDAPLTISEEQLKNRNIKPTDVLIKNKNKEDR